MAVKPVIKSIGGRIPPVLELYGYHKQPKEICLRCKLIKTCYSAGDAGYGRPVSYSTYISTDCTTHKVISLYIECDRRGDLRQLNSADQSVWAESRARTI